MKLLQCAVYLAVTGIIGFLLGRVVPKKWINPQSGLYRCHAFERNGKLYEKIKIHRWHNLVPSMSRILPFMMPAKNLKGNWRERLPLMIHETCVAELIHWLLCISALYCLRIWPGTGGEFITIFYILVLNLPFILIQRYNRPRLLLLQQKSIAREQRKKENLCAH